MAIETHDGGTTFTDDGIRLYQLLANWTRGSLEVCGSGGRVNPQVFHWMAAQTGSAKRTHAGIMVDYTIWLAEYGIEPSGTSRLAEALNKSGATELRRGLLKAKKVAEDRKAAAQK